MAPPQAPRVPSELSAQIEGFFIYRNAEAVSHEITPADDGSTVVVELQGNQSARLYVCGPEPSHRPLVAVPGGVWIGVRLRPGIVPELFGVGGQELSGKRIFLDDVFPKDARRLVEAASAPDLALRGLFDFVRDRAVAPRRTRGLDRVRAALRLLAGPTPMSLDDVVRELQMAPRTFRREFGTLVGLGPKRFSRVVRLRRAARRVSTVPLATLALEYGFADQAHMTREFVSLVGVAPRELRRIPLPFVPGATGSLVG